MAEKITIADALQFDAFDPTRIDVSEINALTAAIPADGNVDANIAENMATRFLRGADRCSELLAVFTWWAAKKEDEKRHVYSAKFFEAPAHGHKTAAARKAYAEGADDYLAACDAANKAKAMKQWVQNKHDSLVSAHYLMKQISKSERRGEPAAGGTRDHSWEGSQKEEPSWGEQSW